MRNLGQTMCLRCRGQHHSCLQNQCIPDEQWNVLVEYAKANGRSWRAKLKEEWDYTNELRFFRNTIGPYNLASVQLDAPRFSRRLGGKIKIVRRMEPTQLIEEWFDPQNIAHIKAWRHLCEKGHWPVAFIPDFVDRQSGWLIAVVNKIAEAWVDYSLAKDYVESIP